MAIGPLKFRLASNTVFAIYAVIWKTRSTNAIRQHFFGTYDEMEDYYLNVLPANEACDFKIMHNFALGPLNFDMENKGR